jgi:hypothetical protein
VTRGTIPRFDLYEELEVSRLASEEVIEAAYRSLVKVHHPDVSSTDDVERIKRLNLAREWLKDPVRRRRYDAATSPNASSHDARSYTVSPPPGTAQSAGSRSTGPRSRGDADAQPDSSSTPRTSSPTTFGVNTGDVRHFLAELRALDMARGLQVRDGRAVAHARGYAAARHAALAASRAERHDEWLFAREAAAVIARGKLGSSSVAEQIVDVVGDIAGAIVVRDLIPFDDFELLLLPWTWPRVPTRPRATASPAAATTAPPARPAPGPVPPAPTVPPPRTVPPRRSEPPLDTEPPPGRPPSATGVPGQAWATRARAVGRAVERQAARSVIRTQAVRGAIRARARRARHSPASRPALVAILVMIALSSAMALLNRPPGDAAAIAVGGVTDAPPTAAPAPTAEASRSVPPSAWPTNTPPSIDPALLRELQRGVARTLRDLASAAAVGDVVAAQALLGDSAPDLQASGLRRAVFPDVAATSIAVVRSGAGWAAFTGTDRLASDDGSTWTLDYADRPLARFTSSAERNLYWVASDGRHDLNLRVASVTFSRSGLAIRFAWRYGSGSADDPWFRRTEIAITSITLGTRQLTLTTDPTAVIGTAARAATVQVAGGASPPSRILIQVTVGPGPSGSGTVLSSIEALFGLEAG